MDTLTHALTGAVIADSWFRRRLGPLATPFSLFAAALPDADMFTYFVAPEYAWAHHRGYSHSFFLQAVAAPLLGYAGYRLSRRSGGWGWWTLLALVCLFSHTILDLATSWGTMPWLPFSNARVSLDIAPVIDLFLLAVTAASFVANRLLRWERVDTFMNPLKYPIVHRHPRRVRAATRVAAVALALVAVYLCLGWHQNRQIVRYARQELARNGVEAVEVRALPIMFTYIAWDIVARDGDGAVYNAVHSNYAPRSLSFIRYPTLPRDEIARELATKEGAMFAWYSQDMFVTSREWRDAGSRTTFADRRFFTLTDPDAARFLMLFDKDAEGRIGGIRSVQEGISREEVERELGALWALMWDGAGAETAE